MKEMEFYWKRQSRGRRGGPWRGTVWAAPTSQSGCLGASPVHCSPVRCLSDLGCWVLEMDAKYNVFFSVLSTLLILWSGQDPPLWALLCKKPPFSFLVFLETPPSYPPALFKDCLPFYFHLLLLNLWMLFTFGCLMQAATVKLRNSCVATSE